MTLTIRNKIIIITMAILLLAVSVNSALISYIYSSEHYDVLQANSYILAQNLGYQMERLTSLGLNLGTIYGFSSQCQDIVTRYRNISYSLICDSKGNIVFSYFRNGVIADNEKVPLVIHDAAAVSYIRKGERVTRTVQMNGSYYSEVYVPVYDEKNNYIGAAGVGFPLFLIVSQLKTLLFVSILVSAVLLAGAVVMLVLSLRNWVTSPIGKLVDVIDEIRSSNELDRRVEIESNDEIGRLASAFNKLIGELDEKRNMVVEKERIEKEMEIAKVIQTSILPRVNEVPGYEVSCFMRPAFEVGGDYYDITRDIRGNSWVNIGDVMGHGVTAGLIMMMLQSTFVTAVNSVCEDRCDPVNVYNLCNKIIYTNVKTRLLLNQFITSCFFKCHENGEIEYVGAHEHIIIYRSALKKVEIIPTQGIWLGLMEDISSVIKNYRLVLEKEDFVFLYTDGLVQMRNEAGEEYLLERLAMFIEMNGSLSPDELHKAMVAEIDGFKYGQEDDITFIILKKI